MSLRYLEANYYQPAQNVYIIYASVLGWLDDGNHHVSLYSPVPIKYRRLQEISRSLLGLMLLISSFSLNSSKLFLYSPCYKRGRGQKRNLQKVKINAKMKGHYCLSIITLRNEFNINFECIRICYINQKFIHYNYYKKV